MQVTQGFVETQGHRLAYLAVNEHLASDAQPAIIFIHGVLASASFWLDCVPPEFKENRAWYSLSLPAHHPSTVPPDFEPGDVNEQWFFRLMNDALKELLGDRKAIIVGHSTGGFCALNLAIHQSPNLVGIVSVGGFHSGQWGSVEGLLVKLAGLGKWARGSFVSNIFLAQRSRFIRRTFASLLAYDRRAYRSNPLSQRMLDNIEQDVLEQDPAALFAFFHGIGPMDIAGQLDQIRVPCYIFAGTHDPVVPAAQSLVLSSRIPHAKTIAFRNVGHMPFMEDTAAYFAALELALADMTEQYHPDLNQTTKQVTDNELSTVQ